MDVELNKNLLNGDEVNYLEIIEGEPESYQCTICLRIFKTKGNSLNHLKCAHNIKIKYDESTPKIKIYGCSMCGKRFQNKCSLKLHMDHHNGNKRFACSEENCDRKFFTRWDLNDHVRSGHTRERPFRCEECGKCFLTGSVFYEHRLIHTDDRRHACNICDKKFFRSSALQYHKLTHTGEKPYPCKFCPSRFRSKGDLKKHAIAVHTIEVEKEEKLLKSSKTDTMN